jgi:hypothetical protein
MCDKNRHKNSENKNKKEEGKVRKDEWYIKGKTKKRR